MNRRAAKRQGDRFRGALSRAHAKLHGHEYELDLLRRANEALSRRSAHEISKARSAQQDMAEQLAQLRRCMADVERMVGPYAIAAGDPKFMATHVHGDELSIAMIESMSAQDIGRTVSPMEAVARSHRKILRRLEIRAVRDEVKQAVHVRARLGDGKVGYFMSDEAMYFAPVEVIARRIAEEMTEHLIAHLRSSNSRSRHYQFGDLEYRPPF